MTEERSDVEILARVEAIRPVDFLLPTQRFDLIIRLSFEAAKPFLGPDATPESWGEPKPRDAESVKGDMLKYMPFAWEKANNCRGLSAARTLGHMSAWLWLMGMGAAADQIQEYNCYGKPQLRAICEHFGWDWRQWDDGKWRNDEAAPGAAPPKTVPALLEGDPT